MKVVRDTGNGTKGSFPSSSWLGRYLFLDFVCCYGKKKPYLHMKLKCFLHQKRNIICKRHIQLCHSNPTRLSADAAPALKGTGRVGVTSGGLVKAQTWFPPPLWKPGRWFKQNGVKTVQCFSGGGRRKRIRAERRKNVSSLILIIKKEYDKTQNSAHNGNSNPRRSDVLRGLREGEE